MTQTNAIDANALVNLSPTTDSLATNKQQRQVRPVHQPLHQTDKNVGIRPSVGVDHERLGVQVQLGQFRDDEPRVRVALLGQEDDGVVVPEVVLQLERR